MKKTKTFFIILISLHFILIIVSQLKELKILNNKFSQMVEHYYTLPYLEQNWGMFSPNPPQGNQFIMIKFRTNNSSVLIDSHKKIRENSNKGFLNLDQRLMKYQIECFNDIINKIQANELDLDKPNIKNSIGLQSTMNYSLFVLKKQEGIIENSKPTDSIFIDLYLIDDVLDKPKSKNKYKGKYYTEIKNIFLTTKNEYDKLQL